MWLRSLFDLVNPGTPRRRPAFCRLSVEALEDRTVLSTFTVLNLADSGDGSLRVAILGAEANPGADVIPSSPATRPSAATATPAPGSSSSWTRG